MHVERENTKEDRKGLREMIEKQKSFLLFQEEKLTKLQHEANVQEDLIHHLRECLRIMEEDLAEMEATKEGN